MHSSSLLPGTFRQTKNKLMMTKARSTKIVNFKTTEAGILMLECDHISHFSEYALSSNPSIYSTLIAIVLRDYDAFLFHRWYTKMSPYDKKSDSVKSLILRWPFRPVGLLFKKVFPTLFTYLSIPLLNIYIENFKKVFYRTSYPILTKIDNISLGRKDLNLCKWKVMPFYKER